MRSMTGFGKASVSTGRGTIQIEIKTLNHRFFDVKLRVPPELGMFEPRIKKRLNSSIKRGRVECFLSTKEVPSRISVDKKKAQMYYRALTTLKRSLNLKDAVSLFDIVSFPGVITCRSAEKSVSWNAVENAIDEALKKLILMKKKEGSVIAKDLMRRTKKMQTILADVRKRFERIYKERKRRVVAKNLEENQVSGCDITEELTRLGAHVNVLKELIKKDSEVGRRLDFIAQEIYREENTIGAKAQDFKITRDVVELKSLVENIREQSQNVE